jgi:hypothetical protein
MDDPIKLLNRRGGDRDCRCRGGRTGRGLGGDERRKSKSETHAVTCRSKPVSPFASTKLSPTVPRPGGAGTAAVPLTSASSAAFQKAQELPEMKKVRDEYLESQKRYMEAMKKAVEKGWMSVVGRVTIGQGAGQK